MQLSKATDPLLLPPTVLANAATVASAFGGAALVLGVGVVHSGANQGRVRQNEIGSSSRKS